MINFSCARPQEYDDWFEVMIWATDETGSFSESIRSSFQLERHLAVWIAKNAAGRHVLTSDSVLFENQDDAVLMHLKHATTISISGHAKRPVAGPMGPMGPQGPAPVVPTQLSTQVIFQDESGKTNFYRTEHSTMMGFRQAFGLMSVSTEPADYAWTKIIA